MSILNVLIIIINDTYSNKLDDTQTNDIIINTHDNNIFKWE